MHLKIKNIEMKMPADFMTTSRLLHVHETKMEGRSSKTNKRA